MTTWKAHIEDPIGGRPWDMAVRLHIFRHTGMRLEVMMPDGVVQSVEEGVAPPADSGLIIPRDALTAIAEVFHPHATGQAQLQGELKATRESLAIERHRVENVLDQLLRRNDG